MNNTVDEVLTPSILYTQQTNHPSLNSPENMDPESKSPTVPKPRSTVQFNVPISEVSDFTNVRPSMRSSTSSAKVKRRTNNFFTPTFVEFFQEKTPNNEGSFEDGRVTRVEFEKLQIFDIATAVISLITISLTVFIYDLEFDQKDDSRAIFLLWLLFVTGITTSILNVLRYFQYVEFLKVRHIITREDGLRSSGLLSYLILEQFILLLQPYPFLRNIHINMYDDYYEVPYYYNLNDFLSISVVLRLFIVIRFLLNSTRFRSTRAQRIAGMYGFENNYLFVIKCLFRINPLTFCLVFFSASILIFGYALRICEMYPMPTLLIDRPVNRDAPVGTDFTYYGNSFWVIILTMTTVGFGDYKPTTLCGRIVSFVVCLWGVSIVSLMIVSINNTLGLSNSEKTSLLVLIKLEKRRMHKDHASNLISNLAQMSILKNKWFVSMESKKKIIRDLKAQIKQQAKEFRIITRDLKNMQNKNFREDMQRQFITLIDELDTLKSSQARLQVFLDSLLASEMPESQPT